MGGSSLWHLEKIQVDINIHFIILQLRNVSLSYLSFLVLASIFSQQTVEKPKGCISHYSGQKHLFGFSRVYPENTGIHFLQYWPVLIGQFFSVYFRETKGLFRSLYWLESLQFIQSIPRETIPAGICSLQYWPVPVGYFLSVYCRETKGLFLLLYQLKTSLLFFQSIPRETILQRNQRVVSLAKAVRKISLVS